jgi:transcriptional regulator with XRE-family HTH domain
MFIGVQVEGARGLLHMSQKELAEQSGISFSTIRRIEENRKGTHGQAEIVKKLEKFFTSKGIEFTNVNDKATVAISESKI